MLPQEETLWIIGCIIIYSVFVLDYLRGLGSSNILSCRHHLVWKRKQINFKGEPILYNAPIVRMAINICSGSVCISGTNSKLLINGAMVEMIVNRFAPSPKYSLNGCVYH